MLLLLLRAALSNPSSRRGARLRGRYETVGRYGNTAPQGAEKGAIYLLLLLERLDESALESVRMLLLERSLLIIRDAPLAYDAPRARLVALPDGCEVRAALDALEWIEDVLHLGDRLSTFARVAIDNALDRLLETEQRHEVAAADVRNEVHLWCRWLWRWNLKQRLLQLLPKSHFRRRLSLHRGLFHQSGWRRQNGSGRRWRLCQERWRCMWCLHN